MPPSGDLNKNIMGELKFLKKRERFPLPRTNVQEILYTLLVQGYVSFFDLDYMQGFRARISEIRHEHGIKLGTTKHKRFNKFGNPYEYALHRLPKEEREKSGIV